MLASLTVQNFALVDRATIAFGPGLNVISGETGTGKSILVGALNLLLGGRADKGLIRTGETFCSAEASFHLADTARLDTLLDERGIPPCEEGQLILRRVVRASGASQNIINDASVTLQVMREAGRYLVDLHGPHDHQSLFDPEFQLALLDAYGRHARERSAYGTAYATLRELEARRDALLGPEDGVAEQMDLLAYRISELEQAALDPDEEIAVADEHRLLANAQVIRERGGELATALMESEHSAFDALAAAQRSLEGLAGLLHDAEGWLEEVRTASIQLQELYRSVQSALEAIDADPARLEWLDGRIAVYEKMKRKYGPTLEDALATLASARERLGDLSSRGERLAALEMEITDATDILQAGGRALRKKRRAAGARLAKAVTAELRELGFEHGEFAVHLEEAAIRPTGIDDIEFGFAPNVGEAMRPLRTIASSGEISRVMLATKGVLAGMDSVPVLIFDEIDANIGGEMGIVVGRKLASLADSHQVLCITHLPQVAVFGEAHVAVSKAVRDGRTYTSAVALTEEDRVKEVARMLGGTDQTRVALQHARELLRAAEMG